jgi:hypothetical protein
MKMIFDEHPTVNCEPMLLCGFFKAMCIESEVINRGKTATPIATSLDIMLRDSARAVSFQSEHIVHP